jgi:hypothetical protein
MRNRVNRAYLRGNDAGHDGDQSYIDLEAQPWGLLLNDSVLSSNSKSILFAQIDQQLQRTSPIGPRLKPGDDGLVWPAVTQLMTWAYSKNNRASAAWTNLIKHSYATHALAFPTVWLGIWSGPDGWVSTVSNASTLQPGGTWLSAFTPMTDFPVSNQNGYDHVERYDSCLLVCLRHATDWLLLRHDVEMPCSCWHWLACLESSRCQTDRCC